MNRKMNCVIVDDDAISLTMLEDLCKQSDLIEIVETYNGPDNFLKMADKIQYALIIADIIMPGTDGIELASMLENKLVIFVTGAYDKLKDALEVSPIDVITKPIKKIRLNKALEKAKRFMDQVKTVNHVLFNIAESEDKLNLKMADILFVKSDVIDPRNKTVFLKSGRKYTLMNCTFYRLLELSPLLIKINRTELVSIEAVHQVSHDVITILGIEGENNERHFTLSDKCRKNFMEIMYCGK